MKLSEHKQKVLEEWNVLVSSFGIRTMQGEKVDVKKESEDFISRAIDSTVEETYKALHINKGDKIYGVNMEDKWKEFKS